MNDSASVNSGLIKEPLATISRLRDEGLQALLRHDADRAEEAFCQALRATDEEHLKVAVDLYRYLARACAMTGRFQQAQDLERAADLLKQRFEPSVDLSKEQLARVAEALRGDPDRRGGLGAILAALAMAERNEAASLTAAREHMEEAVAIGLELEPDALATAIRCANLAGIRGLTGDLQGAVEMAATVRDRLRAEAPQVASGMLRTMAQLRARSGDLSDAEADAVEAVKLAADAGAQEEHAGALSALGMIRSEQGDLESAVELYREALVLAQAQADGSVPAAVNLCRLGDVERDRGDLDASAKYYSQAVTILREHAPRSFQLVDALYGLAETRTQAGELGQAISGFREARQLTANPETKVRCAIHLGELYKALGRFQDALHAHRDALADAKALGKASHIIGACMGLAGAHRWSGELDEAERIYTELVESTTGNPFYQAQALSNLGGIYYDRGDYPEAVQRYRQALELVSDPAAVRNINYNLATALHYQGRLAEADALYADVLGGLKSIDRMRAEAISGRGHVALAGGRIDTAVGFFREAVEIAEFMRSAARGDASRSALSALVQRYYDQILYVLQKRGAPGDAEAGLDLAELSRARTLEARLSDSPAPASLMSRTEERRLRQRLAATSRRLLKAQNDPGTHETVRTELRRQERELSEVLDDLEQSTSPAAGSTVLNTAQIQAALAPDSVLLEFQVVGGEMFAWAVTRQTVEHMVLPIDLDELTGKVVAVIGPYHAGIPPEGSEAAWDELRDAVLGPVGHHLRDASTLLVSPAGPLHYISFEPLADGPTIVYIPSATVGLRSRASGQARPLEADFAGFGNPAFDRMLPEFSGLPALPGAEVEVEEIAGLFGRRGVALCGARATESELRSWARRCRYLHVAAHGLVDLDNPMRSGIVLSSPASVPLTNRASHDDLLHGYEMVDLDIAAELVVVAACRTGFGNERVGEGLTTMGSALLQGGAQWVLVSLWPVGDLVSVTFMRAMYEAIIDGAAIPEAVRIARSEIRADHSDPYWWAGFALFGVRA